MKRLVFSFLVLMLQPWADVQAEQYALLVGVNRYPNLPSQFQLNGAVNDVRNLAQFLQKSGFHAQNIRVLSDDSSPELQAHRRVIFSELKSLSERVGAGDLVVTYFALHGSQQPVLRNKRHNEPDDLDEILLPGDVKKWDGKQQHVENAILDDELDVLFTRMRQRGAFVVAGFDTCHAGTMARGGNVESERDRFVPMGELGIPERLQKVKWRTRGVSLATTRFPKSNATSQGGFVGLYASQSDQITKEMKTAEHDWHGVFSHHFLKALTAFPKASYRQIGEQIWARYRDEKRWLSSPQFEGTDLDYQVFDLKPVQVHPQWALEKQGQALRIPAGSLHQFDLGARFSLHRDVASDQVLGLATVVDIQADHARLELDNGGTSAGKLVFEQAQFARLKDARYQQAIRIAVDGKDKQLKELMARLRQTQTASGVVWIDGAKADYQVLRDSQQAQQICILKWGTGDRCGNDVIRLKLSKDLESSLAHLQTAARKLSVAHRLTKISQSLSHLALLEKVELSLQREAKGNQELLALDDRNLLLSTGEKLRLSLKNKSHRALDVTVLSLNQEMGIQTLFPEMPGANRIEAEGMQEVLLEVNNRTRGREQVFVFVSEVQPFSSSDFGFLEQTEIGREGGMALDQERRRGQVLRSLSSMLEAERQRGKQALPQTAIRRLSWITR